jgi:hypothetical protein
VTKFLHLQIVCVRKPSSSATLQRHEEVEEDVERRAAEEAAVEMEAVGAIVQGAEMMDPAGDTVHGEARDNGGAGIAAAVAGLDNGEAGNVAAVLLIRGAAAAEGRNWAAFINVCRKPIGTKLCRLWTFSVSSDHEAAAFEGMTNTWLPSSRLRSRSAPEPTRSGECSEAKTCDAEGEVVNRTAIGAMFVSLTSKNARWRWGNVPGPFIRGANVPELSRKWKMALIQAKTDSGVCVESV